MLKIKSMGRKDVPDADVPTPQLLSWLRSEMRDRDSKMVIKLKTSGHHQQQEAAHIPDHKREQDVKILVGQTRSKKFNRRTVVEQAQVKAATLLDSYLEGPILAVETTSDQVLDAIRDTRLSEPESWRKVEHGVNSSEKKYVREIHDQFDTWRYKHEKKGGTRHSFLYNFRTGYCLYYDLAA